MKVIGLTGGIGSGKSTVAQFLAELGAEVVDLDKVGHETLKQGTETRERVVKRFGREILNNNNDIDRGKLGEIVFADNKALLHLNLIIHPVIDNILNTRLEEYRRKGVEVVVIEAAAMLEAGRAWKFDELWVITAPKDAILDRLRERTGLSEDEARARIESQMPQEEREKHADVVINTDCTLDELKARVAVAWCQLQARMGKAGV
jgi:dephospho-CoA kinase